MAVLPVRASAPAPVREATAASPVVLRSEDREAPELAVRLPRPLLAGLVAGQAPCRSVGPWAGGALLWGPLAGPVRTLLPTAEREAAAAAAATVGPELVGPEALAEQAGSK